MPQRLSTIIFPEYLVKTIRDSKSQFKAFSNAKGSRPPEDPGWVTRFPSRNYQIRQSGTLIQLEILHPHHGMRKFTSAALCILWTTFFVVLAGVAWLGHLSPNGRRPDLLALTPLILAALLGSWGCFQVLTAHLVRRLIWFDAEHVGWEVSGVWTRDVQSLPWSEITSIRSHCIESEYNSDCCFLQIRTRHTNLRPDLQWNREQVDWLIGELSRHRQPISPLD